MLPSSAITASLNRFFEASLLLLVATGFFTLVTTGKLDFVSIVAVSAALLARAYAFLTSNDWQISERWTGYLTILYLAVYVVDLFTGTFVTATVHLVLFSLVVKLFSLHPDRDYVYLAVLSFLSVLAASVLTVDAVFLGSFVLFLVLAVVTFSAFEMRRSAMAAQIRAREAHLAPQRITRSLGWLAMLLVSGIAVGACVIFFSLPRVTTSYLNRFAPRSQFVSGFSNTVQLGDIGRVQQSDAVVMHVQPLPGYQLPADPYWRGVALSLFDGKRWYNPTLGVSTGEIAEANNLFVPSQRNAPRREVRYRVLLEPIGTNVFFGLPFLESVAGNYRNVAVDDYGGFTNFDRERVVSVYTATSNTCEPATGALRRASSSYPAEISLRYLQLPKLDRRVQTLATQIASERTNNYDRARAIEKYLQTKFGYTLELPTRVAADPIANFLFERKEGHCEYFASAMAVMLRAIGIPSRVVNGLHGDEFNQVSGSYLVRARQAHSWVEAYFPGQGWITFDPTPAARTTLNPTNKLALYLDAAHEFWREWVINYDFSHQRTLGTSAIDRSRAKLNSMRETLEAWYARLIERAEQAQERLGNNPQRWTGTLVALLAFIVVAMNGPRIWRAIAAARTARSPRREPDKAATIWYTRMEKVVARRGWHKLPTQTPQEFVSAIEDAGLRDSVARFTHAYQRARFGDSADDAEQLPEAFAEVTKHRG